MLILSNSSFSQFCPGHLNNNTCNTCNTLKCTVVKNLFLTHGQIKENFFYPDHNFENLKL